MLYCKISTNNIINNAKGSHENRLAYDCPGNVMKLTSTQQCLYQLTHFRNIYWLIDWLTLTCPTSAVVVHFVLYKLASRSTLLFVPNWGWPLSWTLRQLLGRTVPEYRQQLPTSCPCSLSCLPTVPNWLQEGFNLMPHKEKEAAWDGRQDRPKEEGTGSNWPNSVCCSRGKLRATEAATLCSIQLCECCNTEHCVPPAVIHAGPHHHIV